MTAHLRKRLNTYIALEDVDFTWDRSEVLEFERFWNEGVSLIEIATYFKRTPLEVTLLVFDRAEAGRIEPRKTGIDGIDMDELLVKREGDHEE